MKKKMYFLVAMLFATGAFAQVRQGTVGEGRFVDWSGTPIEGVQGLDFNNDGVLEFRITEGFTEDGIEVENGGLTFVWSEGGNNIVTPSEDRWDRISNLSEGTTVGPNSGWYAQGDAYLDVEASVYVGFRFKLGSNVHYGWGWVTMDLYPAVAYWHEIYYQSAPNTPIEVGTRGGEGIVPLMSDDVHISTQGTFVNVVCPEGLQVSLFDITGRRLASAAAPRCNFSVPQPGIYLISVGGVMHKVAVF